jgi:hypothetical protein
MIYESIGMSGTAGHRSVESAVFRSNAMKSRISSRIGSLLLGTLLVAGAAGPAVAQSGGNAQGLLDNAWVFNLGGFIFQTDVEARLDGQSSENPSVDFDETFGQADDSTRVRADVLWRITPAHHLRFMYFDNSNSRTRVLDENIEWGDYTFLAGSSATFKQEFDAYALAYEWAFMRTPTYELAASIGLNFMDMRFQLSGNANYSGPDCTTPPCSISEASKVSDLPAPLPMIGLRAGWLVAPNWYLEASGQFFQIEIDGYDGRWSDLRLSGTWMFHRNFGVGLGYNWFGTRVDVVRDDFSGKVKLNYSGLQAYLTGTF